MGGSPPCIGLLYADDHHINCLHKFMVVIMHWLCLEVESVDDFFHK